MGPADLVFIDTNGLVALSQSTSVHQPVAVRSLQRLHDEGYDLAISRQVQREYLSAVTRSRPERPLLSVAQATTNVRGFSASYLVLDDGQEVMDRSLALLRDYPVAGKQVHDANLVATMLVHGVTRLLTFNPGDFRRYEPVIELVPPALPAEP